MLELAFSRGREARYDVLCLGAHSDDIEIGCGGTVLKLIDVYPNLAFHWVVFSADETRTQEARHAAGLFLQNAAEQEVVVKRYRDGFFPYDGAQIKDDFEAIARAFQPDLILTHYRDDRHQDHRVVSDLTWNTFRDHLILEYEIPKYDGDLGIPNVFVRLGEATADRKIAHLQEAFTSQQGKPWFTDETFRSLMRLRGIECRARYAEAFHGRKVAL